MDAPHQPQLARPPLHSFQAAAFVENLALKELATVYPEAARTPHELSFRVATGGQVYIFPFGAVVFMDVSAATREVELARLRRARPGLTAAAVINEELSVREDPGERPDVAGGI